MHDQILYPALLLVSLGVILYACDLFTNGIEWAGKSLDLSHGATGSILAAVGTALPETMVPIIALLSGAGGQDVAVGAIAGSPFMLSTLAMFVSGAAFFVFAGRGSRPAVFAPAPDALARDLGFFFLIYSAAVLATFIPPGLPRYMVAALLVTGYVVYARIAIGHEGGNGGEMEELSFSRVFGMKPNSWNIALQVVVGLALITVGAHFFVLAVKNVSAMFGVPAVLLSLFITPVATELPEMVNSVLWIRSGKDTLALGNITGALVFQASFPVAIGVCFTPWALTGPTMASALIALGSAGTLYLLLKLRNKLPPRALLLGGLLYAGYVVYVVTV